MRRAASTGAIRPAQQPGLCEDIERVGGEPRRGRIEQALGVGPAVDYRGDCAGKVLVAGADELRLGDGIGRAALQDEAAEAIDVVVARQHAAEAGEQRAGLIRRELLLAPERAHNRDGFLPPASGLQRAGQGELAADRSRLGGAVEGEHGVVVGTDRVEGLLGAQAQALRLRPAAMRLHQRDDLLGRQAGFRLARHEPVDERRRQRVGVAGGQRARIRVAPLDHGIERRLQRGVGLEAVEFDALALALHLGGIGPRPRQPRDGVLVGHGDAQDVSRRLRIDHGGGARRDRAGGGSRSRRREGSACKKRARQRCPRTSGTPATERSRWVPDH